MDWIRAIGDAIDYIEENITEELSVRDIADRVNISAFYFQKGFNIEYYSNPADYKGGTQDSEYYAEVWIPVKEK